MMIYVVKQDNVMHDGFQDATSADERPKARYVTFKVFCCWVVWMMSSEMNGVLIMMIYIVKQDNVMHDALQVK